MKSSLRFALVATVLAGSLTSCDSGSNSPDAPPSLQDTSGTSGTPEGAVVAPVFRPAAGTYTSTQSVALASATDGASVFYTTDGSVPTTSSAKYAAPISVGASATLKAIAMKSGMATSPVSTAAYTISKSSTAETVPWNDTAHYGSVTSSGQTYRTVRIGTQTWMAENLNVAVDSSWWYANSPDSGEKYGRLYRWAAMMGLPDSCNLASCSTQVRARHRGICPADWHVPSDSEWSVLIAYIGGEGAGWKLMSKGGWYRAGNGDDVYGFRALPAGTRDFFDDGFDEAGSVAEFWSSSASGKANAWVRGMSAGYTKVIGYSRLKGAGASVRCLRD